MAELELTDADIFDAMQHIPGYLDISTEDFRTLYHLAHRHAVDRLMGGIQADRLMRCEVASLEPDMPLDLAARKLAQSGYKALPVVDAQYRVIGMLTETDFLRQLQIDSYVELLLQDNIQFKQQLQPLRVADAMTAPAVCIAAGAGFREIVAAFQQHAGRSLPVVDNAQCLLGLLLRKDFLAAYHQEDLP